MSAPRVSVIVPTFNRARLLRAALDSALAQTLPDLEVIVVDDGSTDDTTAVLAAVGDARLRCLQQAHRGVSAAVNRGLAVARGAYVARLESDDLWLPDLLALLVAVLDARPEVGVAYAKGQPMDAAGRPLPQTHGMPQRFADDALRSMVYEDFTCNVATLARRASVERAGGYDESLPANEDWDLWLRIAAHDQFAFVDRVLARFRLHDGNRTGPASPLFRAVLDTRTRPLDKLFARPDLPPAVVAMKATAYENVHLFRAQRWLQVRHARAAARACCGSRWSARCSTAPGAAAAWSPG